jgi:hypothetical protein
VPLPEGQHLDLLLEAIAVEGRGHRALLDGDATAGAEEMRAASELYRRSWEVASPTAFGRLVGMLKAAVIAGDAGAAAAYARGQLPDPVETPTASYALAIAALVQSDDETARTAAAGMLGASEQFARAAAAIDALAARDPERYGPAVAAIVADFEGREDHLTGVPIADTALMLECLARERGMASRQRSALLPG